MTELVPVLFGLILIILVLKFIKGFFKFIVTLVLIAGIIFVLNQSGVDVRQEFEDFTGVQPDNVSEVIENQKTDWDQAWSNVANGVSNE